MNVNLSPFNKTIYYDVFPLYNLYSLLGFYKFLFYLLSNTGTGILSGHADGAIVRYMFEDDGSGLTQVTNC